MLLRERQREMKAGGSAPAHASDQSQYVGSENRVQRPSRQFSYFRGPSFTLSASLLSLSKAAFPVCIRYAAVPSSSESAVTLTLFPWMKWWFYLLNSGNTPYTSWLAVWPCKQPGTWASNSTCGWFCRLEAGQHFSWWLTFYTVCGLILEFLHVVCGPGKEGWSLCTWIKPWAIVCSLGKQISQVSWWHPKILLCVVTVA